MCNALSPEKAVIWSVLHGLTSRDLKTEYFAHPTYRRWFDAASRLRQAGQVVDFANLERELHTAGVTQSDKDTRALKRLLRINVPARIRDNASLLMQALADLHHGQRIHIEHLIN